MVARIGVQLPLWFRVERKCSVTTDGRLAWSPTSIKRLEAKVHGQKTKTASWTMQYKHTVARIRVQLPPWFRVERHSSAGIDGTRSGILTSNSPIDVRVQGVEDEDSRLKAVVETYGGKNWGAIAALVPCRTKNQCHNRWRHFLDPSNDQLSGSTGKWAD